MPKPISFRLMSILSDPVWMTATDSLHQHQVLVFWLISCPAWIFILLTAGFWVATAGRTSPPCQNPDTGRRCTEWHRVPSFHWHGSLPGHLVSPKQVPVTHHTRPHACKTRASTEGFLVASSIAPPTPPHLPLANGKLSAAQNQTQGDSKEPARSCSCSEAVQTHSHKHDEELVNWQEQTGMLRISDMHLDKLSHCLRQRRAS